MEVLASGDTKKSGVQDETKAVTNPVCGIPPLHPAKADHRLNEVYKVCEDERDDGITNDENEEERKTQLSRSESLPELTTKLHNEAMKLKLWKTTSDNKLKQKENELDDVRAEVDDQKETIQQLMLINRNLQAKIEEMEESREESYQYRTERCESCTTLKTEFLNLDERLAECTRERDALKDTDRIRKENFEELLEKYRLMNIENEELKILASKEQEECQRLIQEYHGRQESINTLIQQLQDLKEESKEKDGEILSLTRKLTDSNRKFTDLDEEYGILHNILKETEDVVKSQQEQLNYCHKALKRSHSEISKLNTAKSQLLKQYEELQDKDKDMQTAMQALNENITELANERQSLCEQIRNLNDHVKEKKRKIAEVKQDLKRQKKLIKKVSGIANQPPPIGFEDSEDNYKSHQLSFSDIFDDMDEYFGQYDEPLSSSPRRDKKTAQEDEGEWENMLSRSYVKKPSISPVIDQQLPKSTCRYSTQSDSDQSSQHGIKTKPRAAPRRSILQQTSDMQQEIKFDQRRNTYGNGEYLEPKRSNKMAAVHTQIENNNQLGNMARRRMISLQGGFDKENEEQKPVCCPTSRCHSDNDGVKRSRARRLTYDQIQTVQEPNCNSDFWTLPQRQSYSVSQTESNRCDDCRSHLPREKKYRDNATAGDVTTRSSSRKRIPKQDDVNDEIDLGSSSSLPFSDESQQNSSSNSDENASSVCSDDSELCVRGSRQMSSLSEIDAEGILLRKHELESCIIRAKNRTWQSVYMVQEGKILTFYDDQYSKNIGVQSDDKPPMDLTHAQITMATDYTKKKHVFRIRLTTGAQYLFQARDIPELMFWLCSLDAVTHEPEEATAPYGATYPLHIMANTGTNVNSGGKPSGGKSSIWKAFLHSRHSPFKK